MEILRGGDDLPSLNFVDVKFLWISFLDLLRTGGYLLMEFDNCIVRVTIMPSHKSRSDLARDRFVRIEQNVRSSKKKADLTKKKLS